MTQALRLAQKSNCQYQHGAIIARNNRPLFRGFNRNKTHPRWGTGYKNKIHAELDAIRQAIYMGCEHMLYGTTIYVARGDGGCSKPCKWCQSWLDKFQMKVIHT
jgi:cytidine deaminase